MPKFRGIIRELEYRDYEWGVEAEDADEAKSKILDGDGILLDNRFVEGSDLSDREDAVSAIRRVK